MANITLRRSPWRAPLSPMFDRDRGLFSTMFDPAMTAESVGMVPAVEIEETNDEYICVAELPGLQESDIDVSYDDDMLTIRGEKRDQREKREGRRYHVWERSFGTFERVFTFPNRVDQDKISADFKDGVLTVHLPKAANGKGKARSIAINKKEERPAK